jgi:hypothetical protein
MAQDADRSHFRLPIAGCRKHYFGWIGGFSSETYQAFGFSSDRSTPAPQGLERVQNTLYRSPPVMITWVAGG